MGSAMRSLLVVLLASCLAACAPAPDAGLAVPVLACDRATDLCAVYTPGQRGVKVLLVRSPSIVLLREAFVPAGEAITEVRWSPGGLIVETAGERFALDTRTWTLAAVAALPHARRVMART